MKRVLKILALISGAALLVLIGLGFWVRHRYPPERIRKMAAEMAGARLGRQVDIADAQLSLWGGVELKGIRISEARTFSAGTFIEIDRVRILPRLIPLLSRQIIVRSIELNRPRIRIRRSKEGLFNFNDLSETFTAPEKELSSPPSTAALPRPNDGAWSNFLIARATLSEGEITFLDESLPLTVVFRDVDTRISGFSLTDPFGLKLTSNIEIARGESSWKGPLSFQARLSPVGDKPIAIENFHLGLGASSFELTGTLIPLPAPHANLELTLLSLATSDVAAFLPLPDPLKGMRLAGRWTLQASSAHMAATGTFDAQSPTLALSGTAALDTNGTRHTVRLSPKSFRLTESPLMPKAAGTGSLSGQWEIVATTAYWKIAGHVNADGALLSYDEWLKKPLGAPFALTATAEKKGNKDPAINIDLRAPALDVAPGGPWPADLRVSGTLGMTADVQGNLSDLVFALSADGLSLDTAWGTSYHKPKESTLTLSANGRLQNKKNLQISSALLRAAEGTGEIRGEVTDAMKSRTVNLSFKGTIPDLSRLTTLFPSLSEYHLRGQSTIGATVKGTAESPAVAGQIHVSNTAMTPLPGMDLSEVKGSARFDQDRLVIETLQGKAFGSPFTLSGKIDRFDRPTVFLDGKWDRLEIEKMLKVFSPTPLPTSSSPNAPPPQKRTPASSAPIAYAKGVFHIAEITHPHYLGRDFQFKWDFSNVGPDLSVLSGTATVTAATGEIKNVPVAKKINKLLDREGSDIAYKKLAGKFVVQQGVAEVPSFVLNSDQTDFSAQGRVRLGDMESDLRLVLKLPPGSVRGSVGNWITADDGRPTIEAGLKGPLRDPKVKVDYRDTVRRAAQDILKKTIGGWKGKPDRSPAPPPADASVEPENAPSPSIEKDLQDLGRRSLEKIFKR